MKTLKTEVPFTWAWSKNKMWKVSLSGKMYLNHKTKSLIEFLIYKIKAECRQQNIQFEKKKKVYLSIHAELENHTGDALNLIDTIADAIKIGIGVDDRWFAIRTLDWEVKKGGKIKIEISQESL